MRGRGPGLLGIADSRRGVGGGDRILLGIRGMGVRAGKRTFSRIHLEAHAAIVFRAIFRR
jgi:hypothetical protein